MLISLNFSRKEIEYLSDTSCKSFLGEQYGRFDHLFGVSKSRAKELENKLSMMLFVNDYLKAKIIYEYYSGYGIKSSIFTDESQGGFCVWCEKDM
jgi:hypothetical protein